MALFIVGLVLLLGVHSTRMIAPRWRDGVVARVGEGVYKGLYSVLSLVGFVLIIAGFGRAVATGGVVYVPLPGLRHVVFALMLPALVLAVASVLPRGYIRRAVRHPLLIGTALWAFAHLLVNGETAAVILFGAFLAWSLGDLVVRWHSARPGGVASPVYDVVALVAGVALYGALVWRLHEWAFGVSPMA
jgi:uncharacterized membrane protein